MVYIDPYPKSKAERLYKGIMVDKPINVKESLGKVVFESYRGCSPKKYNYLYNLKYKKRYDKDTGLINPKEEVNYHTELVYVSNYSPLGYIQKEIAYIEWLNTKFDGKLNNKIKINEIDLNSNYLLETKWLNK